MDANTGQNETWRDPVGWGGQWGYYKDNETGLLWLGHRYYDPYRARFLTRDPSGYGGGPNLYTFCDDDPINESDPSGLWSLYKAIYTGDGNANDDVYNAALDQGAATLTFEGKTMLNLNKKSGIALLAVFGVGTSPIWPVKKRPEEMREGSRSNTSVMRRINDMLQRSAKSRGFKDGRSGKWLRKNTLREAKTIKTLLKGGFRGRMLRGTRISGPGATIAAIRWGAVGLLYYEAGLSIYTGHQALQQPLIDDDEGQ